MTLWISFLNYCLGHITSRSGARQSGSAADDACSDRFGRGGGWGTVACRSSVSICECAWGMVKQFTRPVMRKPSSSVVSSVAGTQSIDRAWRTLKEWLPQKLKTYEKINGHHKMSQGLHSMIQQFMWRQTILPCSPQKMMSCLVDLLKKYHDFQWRFHPLKQIVWLHRKKNNKTYFSPWNYVMKPL